jgi:DNA (cytosine-5)-methyltransferase 1
MIRKGADLFCGAGGTSAGYLAACAQLGAKADLLAINHWPRAIATHELNHRGVKHLCEKLENVKPRDVVPSGHLHLLCASPECTHHSRAAGGRPRNDQSRATAWHVCNWLADLTVDAVLIENVPEFVNWGPLRTDGKPNKRKKGQHFKAFRNALGNLGYTLDHRLLVAADYGDPTTRERFFLMGRKRGPIAWPQATHAKGGADGCKPWRPAREIIDWDLKGKSIFGRKKPLSPNTIRRIAAGLRKFGGINAQPFLVMLYGTNDARSLDRPAPAVTAGGNHIGLAEPFLVNMKGQSDAAALNQPAPTVTAHAPHLYLCEPFIVPQFSGAAPRSVERPLGVVTTTSRGIGLVEPFIVHSTHHGARNVHGTGEPLPTVTGANRGEMALVEPFTVMTTQASSLGLRSIDEPVQTVTTAKGGEVALVEPFIVKYFGKGENVISMGQPLATVTTKDRFMLVEPRTGKPVAELDILFRMLQPHELAAAQGFPADYQFTGTREERVKQIGNAVPVNLATALCRALLQ